MFDAAFVGFQRVGDQKSGIHLAHEYQRVCDEQNRRCIQNHVVIRGAQPSQEVIQSVIEDQFRSIGRYRAGRVHVQGLDGSQLPHLFDRATPNEKGTQAKLIRKFEVLVNLGFVHVKVNERNLFARFSQNSSQVCGYKRLALTRV